MPDLKQQMTQAQIAEQLANLFGSYIDKPNDPQARGTLQDPNFYKQFNALAGPSGYTAGDVGFLQQNPQYRGIRMVLPQSGGSYGQAQQAEGYYGNQQGLRRMMTQGPVGMPDATDRIPLVPPNAPSDRGGLREMILGHMIARGYPVYGGNGDLGGDFQSGFNPVGFGQRDERSSAPAGQHQEMLRQGSDRAEMDDRFNAQRQEYLGHDIVGSSLLRQGLRDQLIEWNRPKPMNRSLWDQFNNLPGPIGFSDRLMR